MMAYTPLMTRAGETGDTPKRNTREASDALETGAAPPAPRVAQSFDTRTCAHCGSAYVPRTKGQRFCPGSHCRQRHHRLAEVRGAQVYEHLMRWRGSPRDGAALTEVAAIVDGWKREDKERHG